MSKIALSGNASGTGTFTIASPNSNTDRTLNLPDASGTMVVTGSTELTPPGTVIWYAANAAPTGYLKANGAAVSRTTYAALFAAIGTTFGSGDGSTTFNVPELRGEFIRAWADGRAVDTGRVFGSAQTDAFQGHRHSLSTGSFAFTGEGNNNFYLSGSFASPQFTSSSSMDATEKLGGAPREAAETRSRNLALLACIKF